LPRAAADRVIFLLAFSPFSNFLSAIDDVQEPLDVKPQWVYEHKKTPSNEHERITFTNTTIKQ
jgi:hypothetical protein